MSIANQVQATVIIGAETTFGVAAAQNLATAKTLRRMTTSLAGAKDVYSASEARPDLQLADMRHGTLKPGGGIEGELCLTAYDDLLQACMRGTWTPGVSILPATYTTAAFANSTGTAGQPGSTGTITLTAGSFLTALFKQGDIIRCPGFGVNANYNFRIIGLTGSVATVTPSPQVLAATAGTSISVTGNKLMNGTVKRSFTIEQLYPDITVSELFTGMRVNTAAIKMPPNGLCTAAFTFMGQSFQVLDTGTTPPSPYYTAAVPVGTNGLFAGPQGALRFNGVEQGVITAFDLNIDNHLDAPPVVGSVIVPDIFYGGFRVTGTVSFFLQDKSLLNVFSNETEADLVAFMPANMAAPADFICFNMERVKLGGATKTVAASSGVIVQCPFSALLATTANQPNADVATLVIQRSN